MVTDITVSSLQVGASEDTIFGKTALGQKIQAEVKGSLIMLYLSMNYNMKFLIKNYLKKWMKKLEVQEVFEKIKKKQNQFYNILHEHHLN